MSTDNEKLNLNIALVGSGAGRTTLCRNLNARKVAESAEKGMIHRLLVRAVDRSYEVTLCCVPDKELDSTAHDVAVFLFDIGRDNRAVIDPLAEKWLQSGRPAIFVANKSDLLVPTSRFRQPGMKVANPKSWLRSWSDRGYPTITASSLSRVGIDDFLLDALNRKFGLSLSWDQLKY